MFAFVPKSCAIQLPPPIPRRATGLDGSGKRADDDDDDDEDGVDDDDEKEEEERAKEEGYRNAWHAPSSHFAELSWTSVGRLGAVPGSRGAVLRVPWGSLGLSSFPSRCLKERMPS